jgi:hypothetical protein
MYENVIPNKCVSNVCVFVYKHCLKLAIHNCRSHESNNFPFMEKDNNVDDCADNNDSNEEKFKIL